MGQDVYLAIAPWRKVAIHPDYSIAVIIGLDCHRSARLCLHFSRLSVHSQTMTLDVNSNRPFDQRLFLMDQELDRGVALMLRAERALLGEMEKARANTGLSKSEMQVLMAIKHQPDKSVGDIRKLLAMTIPTFARLIGELDRRGLIERHPSHMDRRRRRLVLSDAGAALTTPITIALREKLRTAFRKAGPDAVSGARTVFEAISD